MKTLILSAAAATLMSTSAFAGGLDLAVQDAPVMVPPTEVVNTWTGVYAGVSYGQTELTDVIQGETVMVDCKEQSMVTRSEEEYPICIPTEETMPDSIVSLTEDGEMGGFVGYRQTLGTAIVVGAEAGVIGDLKTLEAHAGLAVGNVLPYAFAGVGQFDGTDGNVYGGGVDVQLGSVLVGVKHTIGEFGTIESETTSLRVGFSF